MIRKWKENLAEVWETFEFWTRGIALFIYELLIEWLKITTTVIVMLLIPLGVYIVWDLIYSDLQVVSYYFAIFTDWMADHMIFCTLIVIGMVYITYLQTLELRRRKQEMGSYAYEE